MPQQAEITQILCAGIGSPQRLPHPAGACTTLTHAPPHVQFLLCGFTTTLNTPCVGKLRKAFCLSSRALEVRSAVGGQPGFNILQSPAVPGLVEDLEVKSIIDRDGFVA